MNKITLEEHLELLKNIKNKESEIMKQYKKYVAYLHKCYRKNLISKESYLNSFDTILTTLGK